MGVIMKENRIQAAPVWANAQLAVRDDMDKFFQEEQATSDEKHERHGTSWGRLTDQELEDEFIDRMTSLRPSKGWSSRR
jgi:hypothetical protein